MNTTKERMQEGVGYRDLPSWHFLQGGLDRRRDRKRFKRRLHKARRRGWKRQLAEDPYSVERLEAGGGFRSDPWYWAELVEDATDFETACWRDDLESEPPSDPRAPLHLGEIRFLLGELRFHVGRLADLPPDLGRFFAETTRAALFELDRRAR